MVKTNVHCLESTRSKMNIFADNGNVPKMSHQLRYYVLTR